MIQATCSSCGRQYSLPDDMAGTACFCESCGCQFAVPARNQPIRFQCGQCGKSFVVSAEAAGTQAHCSQCGNILTVPALPAPDRHDPLAGALDATPSGAYQPTMQLPSSGHANFGQFPQAGKPASSRKGWLIAAAVGGGLLVLLVVGVVLLVLLLGGDAESDESSNQVADASSTDANTTDTNSAASNGTNNTAASRPAKSSQPNAPRIAKDEIDPKRFPEVELNWSISGQSSDVSELRKYVTDKLELRGVRVVNSSQKKMIVNVQPGPSRTENVRIINTGQSFSVTIPSFSVDVAYMDGSKILWAKKRPASQYRGSIPTFINDPNPQQYVQDRVRDNAWSSAESFIRSAIPFPLSQHELDQIALAEERRKEYAAQQKIREAAQKKAARNGLAAKVEWSVEPDPWANVVDEAAAPIRLELTTREISDVRYSHRAGGRILVVSKGSRASGDGSETKITNVEVFDTAGGAEVATLTLEEDAVIGGLLDDGKSIVVGQKNVVAIRSVETGEVVRQWELEDIEVVEWLRPAQGLILTRSDTYELTAWDAATGAKKYAKENIAETWFSPTQKYLVVCEKHGPLFPGHIYETATGKVVGNLPHADAGSVASLTTCAFSPDGTKLIGISRSKLIGWDLATGAPLQNLPGMYSGTPFGFVSDQLMISSTRLYTFGESSSIWYLSGGSIKELAPSGLLWIAVSPNGNANAYLVPLRIPEQDVLAYIASNRGSSGRVRSGSTTLSYENVMRQAGFLPNQPDGSVAASPVRIPTSSSPPAKLYQSYAATVLADDDKIVRHLKWFPAAKRPSIGEQWGVGVIINGTTIGSKVKTFRDFEQLTGEVGSTFITELQKRSTRGDFGDWKAGNAALLATTTLVSSSDQTALMKSARDQNLDLLAVFDVTQVFRSGRVDEERLTIRICDLHNRCETWDSPLLRSSQVIAAKQKGEDVVKPFIDTVMARIDAAYALSAMPDIPADIASQRAAQFASSSSTSPIRMLAETRYYQAKQLISDAAVLTICTRLFGAADSERFIAGGVVDRQNILSKWLSSQ